MSKYNTVNFRKNAILMALLGGVGFNTIATEQQLATPETERFIVQYKLNPVFESNQSASSHQLTTIKQNMVQTIAASVQANVIQELPSINAVALILSAEQKAMLETNPDVASIEVDPKRYLLAESTPYGINMVQAPLLSDAMSGNRKVCIMDTGYTLNHPDLPNTGITGDDGYGNNDTGNWYNDGNGHGTHVAGTIAAIGGNNQGVVGVNPSGQLGLHIVKVFNDQGNWAYGSDLIKAISQCQAAGANITSMSLGGSGSSAAERQAFDNSYAQGMLHIAAAGNDGNSSLSYPASYNSVVSVAAVDSSENKASFSQFNNQVEIAAPGVGVNSTWNNNGYKSISGTSMATPHVSGVAALVWSNNLSCSNQQVRDAINKTAKDKGAAGRDTSYGFGLIQAKAAADYLANDCGTGGGTDAAPIARFSANVTGKQVSFTNQSTDDKGITSYAWQFGDSNNSTSTAQNPSFTYNADGQYTVRLTVKDTAGQSAFFTQVVTINTDTNTGCDGLASWNNATSYKIGDKVAHNNKIYEATWWSTGANPEVYSNVWKRLGNCSGDGDNTNKAPVANFSFNTNQLSVSFTDTSSDDKAVASYAWSFGDGATSMQASPSHTYTQAGSYLVSLTVKDAEGLEATKTQQVQVSESQQGCSGVVAWSTSSVYVAGDQVAYQNTKYTANWWTKGDNPADNSGQYKVWTANGSCQ
ncbi:S8 family serine peptidase [Pseudoalteromonas tunicata]|uniref:S8 family serine peptidase n=1 Tax=Pseudoalteromonas tunicata TaxID=314281 RepID=UPI00273DF43C|nr:S8 family serine peptidase [Pseudoalteromonas tunicata]MDP5211477.1 S8 family serine peptidase [Pseudoalteromonas tunicata]